MNGARAVALLLLFPPPSGAAQAALTPADSAILNSQPLRRLVLAPSVMRRVSLLAAGLDREVVLCLRGAIRGDTAVVDDFVMPDIVASACDRLASSKSKSIERPRTSGPLPRRTSASVATSVTTFDGVS